MRKERLFVSLSHIGGVGDVLQVCVQGLSHNLSMAVVYLE